MLADQTVLHIEIQLFVVMEHITEETKNLNALASEKVSLPENMKWTLGLTGSRDKLHICCLTGRGKHYTFHKLEIKNFLLFNNTTFFAAKGGEAIYCQQKQDQELAVAQIVNFLLPN